MFVWCRVTVEKSEQKDRSKPSGKMTVTGRIFTTAVVSFNIPKSGLFADIMHQSIETPPPLRPPGHSGEFNIYAVLKDGLFPRPRGQEAC